MSADARQRVYLDANVFINAVEGVPEIADPAIALLDHLRQDRGRGVTSEITLLEILPKAHLNGGPELHRRYVDLIVQNDFFTLVPVSRDILYQAIEHRRAVQFAGSVDPRARRAIDAIHVATAGHEGCTFFITSDERLQPAPIRRLKPDSAALAMIGLPT